ncbi:vinorine synthase [Phtheirospermum japonicum]|uniref:Vinorine synthase n=1 Tax=Phtheirospermum japonicum TaxID=374723 RepID=A0A830CS11_9LAMI|nr:vinorine synthase [Phtheirospermum japonicum]
MNAGSVDVISREIIKPSSPTPHTHKTLKLSFLDQLAPPFYVPVIFFYQADELKGSITKNPDITTQISQNMKKSFSDALSLFYPLAGKLDPGNLAVDCNDAGAEFVQARVHARMDDVIQDPEMDQLLKYLPMDPTKVVGSGDSPTAPPPPPLLDVQINLFDCGGIAVGVCSSHQLSDANSLVAFIRTWAESCRRRQGQKGEFTPPPIFDLARHFPPRDLSGSGFSQSVYLKREKLVTKRFIFDTEKLAALRGAATSPSGSIVKDPTRVELVSAFIWKNINGSGKNQLSAAWHVVNLRPRITSPAMENVFGNCILKQYIFSDDVGPEFHEPVGRLRSGLREVNEEYIWKAGKDDGYLNGVSKAFDLTVNGEMETCGFSSWSRFPVYDVDFGMGKPVWVCPTSCPEKNVCFLMGTKDGDGIELLVNMLETSAQLVESKFQLLAKSEV